MEKIKTVIDEIARTDIPVLIQGESGTGKELVAQARKLSLKYGGIVKRQPIGSEYVIRRHSIRCKNTAWMRYEIS